MLCSAFQMPTVSMSKKNRGHDNKQTHFTLDISNTLPGLENNAVSDIITNECINSH